MTEPLAIGLPGPLDLLILSRLLFAGAALFAIIYFAVRLANRPPRR